MSNSYKIELGVKLNTSEIRSQVSKYNGNSNNAKLRLGVKLDTRGISEQIRAINTRTPITIGLRLNDRNVQNQLNNIRRQIEQLGNIRINLGGAGGSGGRNGRNVINDTYRAYRELISLQNRIGSKQQAVARLDTGRNQQEIIQLTSQIDNLYNRYQRLYNLFSQNFSIEQIDNLNRNFQITGENLDVINRRLADTSAQQRSRTEIENLNNELTELRNVASQIGRLEIDIFKLDGNSNANEIQVLENQLNSLRNTYDRLINEFNLNNPNLSIGQLQELDTVFANTENRLNQLQARVSDTKAKLAEEIKVKIDTDISKDLTTVHSDFDKLSNKTSDLKQKLDMLDDIKIDLDTAKANNDIEGLINANKDYERVLKEVKTQLETNKRLERDAAASQKLIDDRAVFQSKIDAWLSKNSAATKKFGSAMLDLKAKAESCDRVTLDHLQKEFKQLDMEADKAGLKMQTLGDRIKTQFSKYSQYFSVASVIMYGTQAMKDMFNQVVAIDSKMTELKKVTDETASAYDKFLSNASSRAKEIGTTIDGLVSSTADFARLGYGFEDAQGLAEVANIYAVVGDEIEGVEYATESLISTMAAFKDEAKGVSNTDFAMSIIDKFNEIGNKFAISSGGIGEAMKRSASSLDAANNSIDESIALITAANTVVQNPDKVGNAFKTISMRIRGAKTELEEAGESTEGMAESTASMRKEIMALSGVDIMLNKNTFKSTYQIMDELANKWEDLSDIAQASIIELMAGKHQGNVFASLMANFDTARKALEVSENSAGSAMAEHEKWSESLEAKLLKLKATWQSLSQSFMSSNFLKSALDGVIALVNGFDKLIDTFGTLPTLLGIFAGGKSLFSGKGVFTFDKDSKSIKTFGNNLTELKGNFAKVSTAINTYNSNLNKSTGLQNAYVEGINNQNSGLGKYLSGLNGAKASMKGYISHLAGAAIKTVALEVATVALNAALTMGISALISFGIRKLDEWIVTADELAEKVDEVTSKYKEQHSVLTDIKGDYDTSNEDSMISKYEKLSKGVDNLGRNVSLTSEEYSEYQGIVNSIANQIPSLVSGYDEQGNALLSCKGNVEALTEAYEKLIHAQNQEILTNTGNIEKDFENTLKDADKGSFLGIGNKVSTSSIELLEKVLNGNYSTKEIEDLLKDLNTGQEDGVYEALKAAGVGDMGNAYTAKEIAKTLSKQLKEDKSKIKGIVDDYYTQFAEDVEQQKTIAQAKLSEAFDVSNAISGLNYGNISQELQTIANQTVNSLDFGFFENLKEKGKTVEQWTTEMLDQLNSISESDNKEIESAFDLQTKFNGGEISYGEYVQGLKDVESIIDGLDLKKTAKNQLKISLGLDDNGVIEQYNTLRNRLVDHTNYDFDSHIDVATAEKFLNNLSTDELSVAVDIIAELSDNNVEETIQDIRDAINREMAVQGLTFDLNLEVEAAGIDALNTAMAESVSGAGLSSESISALKGRYAELESEGYNLSAMFEETSNGIHVNRNAVRELEQAYANQKKTDITEQLGKLEKEYKNVTRDIENCNDASERAALYVQRDAIIQQINDAATLAAQYDGLASSYNSWLSAEEAGQERDMYENLLEGFENIGDEISRGWLDDGTIEFLELLTGRTDLATLSAKELKNVYKGLDENIKDTSHSIRDFFTVDEDGNSTSQGVYNFLDAIGQLEEEKFGGKDVVKRDKNGKILEFDIELAGGEKAIADALGVSEELVQIMLRAADDAGFVVNLDGTYTQLADLKTEAEKARDTLISLKKDGLEKLKDTDVNFNLDAEGQDLVDEQTKAVKLLDKFRNKDGTINTKLEGADEALEIAEYLTLKLDDLTEPKYMKIDTSTVDENLREPIEKMQEFERLAKEKHLLTLTGDKKKLQETETQMKSIAEYLDKLDEETQVELGIDGLTSEEIAEKLEKGEIEIPAELNVDLQMSDDLKDMRLMMMNQLGLVSDDEVKLKVGFDIDESIVDGLTDEQQKIVVKYFADHEEVDDYTPEQKEALVKYLADGGNLDGYTPEEKQGIVKYLADGGSIDNYTPEQKQAIVEYLTDTGEPDNWTPEQKEAVAKFKKDSAEVDNYSPEDKKAIAKFIKNSIEPDTYQPPDKTQEVKANLDSSEPDNYKPKDKKFTVKAVLQKIGDWTNKLLSGGSKRSVVNGTANVNGTTGRAFKQGSWGVKDSGTALVGELGAETLVRDGRYYTIGDAGAEFVQYKKGDIIFNHRQTEELFKNGKVTSGGGRGKALAYGTAFSNGTGGGIEPEVKSVTVGTNKNTGKSYTKSSSDSKEDFEETIDFIEIALKRVQREINNLDQKANNIYKSWYSRNIALSNQISKVGNEINLQQQAYEEYMKAANGVGLSSSWANKVKSGQIDISTIKDEVLAEKIKDYQDYYEKALACKDAIEELREEESKLYAQRIENVATQYEGILSVIEHEKNMIEEYISQNEANAQLISGEYYKALVSNENETISELQKQKNAMLSELQTAMNSGTITKYSEGWYEIVNSIDEVTLSIAESQTQIKEWEQTIQQLSWETFDLLQDKISSVTEEADFLIELMSSDKLHDDKGKLTDEGSATMGLHGQNYNTYMYQADLAAKEAERLKNQMSTDGYDTELEERYREMIALQQEYILSAEDEKNAIRDLVSDGIELELDALQELIDKKNEELESERDLYEYQKKVLEQTKEISSLEKQIASYSGDTSEEAKTKIQELKVSLEEAKADLEETEYDKYISDQSALLDNLYLEYETVLNTRLDNLDALVSDVIAQINMDATSISTTLSEKADSVGYTLSNSMTSIWDTNSTKINSVITTYGERFTSAQTTTNNALSTINSNLQKMITQLNSIAKTNTKSASTSSAANNKKADTPKPATTTPKQESSNTNTVKTIKVGGMVNASGAQIYDYAGDTSGERQLYRNDPKYKVLKTDGNWIQVRWHKLSSGVTGWFKKGDVKAYKTGVENLLGNEVAWTQENGKEFIVRPSDGAILTPLAKGDSVLNANASRNIWDMANSPADFIKNNLNLGGTNIPNNSNVQNNVTQHIDVTQNFPNVKSYEEMLVSLSRDPKFQKLVNAMTTDQYLGKSSLTKGKVIR